MNKLNEVAIINGKKGTLYTHKNKTYLFTELCKKDRKMFKDLKEILIFNVLLLVEGGDYVYFSISKGNSLEDAINAFKKRV